MPESLTSEISKTQRPFRIQLNETTEDFCVLPIETSRYKDKRAPGKVFKLMTCCSTLLSTFYQVTYIVGLTVLWSIPSNDSL